MESNQLNRWLTLGANFGVLLGIILLIVELDQNRIMMRAQTRNDISRQITDFLSQVAVSNELSSLKFRAEGGKELSAEDEYRYGLHFVANTRFWENIYYQYQQGLFEDSEYEAERQTWGWLIVKNKRFKSSWCPMRDLFSTEFAAEIENMIPGEACSPKGT